MKKRERKVLAIRIEDSDRKALDVIRETYGIGSDNQAVILAIRILANYIQKGGAAFPPAP